MTIYNSEMAIFIERYYFEEESSNTNNTIQDEPIKWTCPSTNVDQEVTKIIRRVIQEGEIIEQKRQAQLSLKRKLVTCFAGFFSLIRRCCCSRNSLILLRLLAFFHHGFLILILSLNGY